MGATLGWSSPVQPQLQQNSTLNWVTNRNSAWYIYMNDDQISWVGSLINIGASIGAICGGFLMDRFGRVFTLMAISVPYLVGWLLIAFAVDPRNFLRHKSPSKVNIMSSSANYFYLCIAVMLYLGRVLCGLAAGISCAVAPCYIGKYKLHVIQ